MSAPPLVLMVGALHVAVEEGIVADAAVAVELGCRCACVATGVVPGTGAAPIALPRTAVLAQLDGALHEVPHAVRIGGVAGAADASELAARVAARSGAIVLAPELSALRAPFLPAARVVVIRAKEIDGFDALKAAARRVRDEGARAVLVAGAAIGGRVVDLLDDEGRLTLLDTSRIPAPHVPGLAGSHASALAAHLAHGVSLDRAAEAAQRYVGMRLRHAR